MTTGIWTKRAGLVTSVGTYGVFGLRSQLMKYGVVKNQSIPQIWWNDPIPRTSTSY